MRVIYIHQYFNTPDTVGSTRSYEMARRLVRAGHEVHMVTSQREEDAGVRSWYETEEAGIHVHWIPILYSNHMSYRGRIQAFVRFAWLAARKAASLSGEIVFATSTPLTIALPAIYAARRNRIPMVFEVRDLWPEVPIAMGVLRNPMMKLVAKGLEWVAYHSSRHIVALSPGMAQGAVKRGVAPERVTVITNSCDVELFDVPSTRGQWVRDELGLSANQPLVVYTGTFGAINGVSYLVEIASTMQTLAPDIRFLLVGEGKERDEIIIKAKAAGVHETNLWVWSPIAKHKMPEVLAAATVTTSLFIPLVEMWNNSANKFFDSLAAGKPIAINYGGWQAELLEESGAGLVLPPDNPSQAAGYLADFLRSPERIRQAGEAARQLAYHRFNREAMAQKLEKVLLQATKKV
jgi:glycosyltransferase involved in cell wall biosynthesis